MVQHIVFWDYLDGQGWGEITSMHRSPHRLAQEALALGAVVDVPQQPFRDGWVTKGWVQPLPRPEGVSVMEPAPGNFEWRMTRDPSYRVPISEFLSYLPAAARVQARASRASDPVLDDFMILLEMAAQEGRGINPHGPSAREGLGYLVYKGWMTQAQADAITDAANDQG
ncbi:MAG: hypothetical protein ACK4MV_16585 [Beijerinckiaceae bacterium]